MKALKWIAYLSTGIGLLLVLLGSISAVFHVRMLQVNYMSSYFIGANSFFLITLIIFLYIYLTENKKI